MRRIQKNTSLSHHINMSSLLEAEDGANALAHAKREKIEILLLFRSLPGKTREHDKKTEPFPAIKIQVLLDWFCLSSSFIIPSFKEPNASIHSRSCYTFYSISISFAGFYDFLLLISIKV